MKYLLFLAFVLGSVGLGACSTRSSYVLDASHEETIANKLDAEWFTRDIYDGSGRAAVELVYCPIQPSTPTVCRTDIVWRRGQSKIMDMEPNAAPASVAPPAASAPAPAPATP